MAKDKVSSKSTKEVTPPVEEKKPIARGHRQRGAGTVITAKAAVTTTDGITLKPHERLPFQLLHEFCQREKRPNPKYQACPVHDSPGMKRMRVILEDSKNSKNDLTFSPVQAFETESIAKDYAALLALYHFQRTLPLERKLPQPYASTWLQMVNGTATNITAATSTEEGEDEEAGEGEGEGGKAGVDDGDTVMTTTASTKSSTSRSGGGRGCGSGSGSGSTTTAIVDVTTADWLCATCGNENKAFTLQGNLRKKCFKCQSMKTDACLPVVSNNSSISNKTTVGLVPSNNSTKATISTKAKAEIRAAPPSAVLDLRAKESFVSHSAAEQAMLRERSNKNKVLSYADALKKANSYMSITIPEGLLERLKILLGETGCGKTTQIPQYIIEHRIEGKVLVVQPRRLAAIAVAERVAIEMGSSKCGSQEGRVGYMVKGDVRASSNTQILFVTYGVLLRRLQEDNCLEGVDCIILDEVHERGVDSDFSLALLLPALQKRPSLQLILMSATIATEKFQQYLYHHLYEDKLGDDNNRGSSSSSIANEKGNTNTNTNTGYTNKTNTTVVTTTAAGEEEGKQLMSSSINDLVPIITIPGKTFPVQEYFKDDIIHLLQHYPLPSHPEIEENGLLPLPHKIRDIDYKLILSLVLALLHRWSGEEAFIATTTTTANTTTGNTLSHDLIEKSGFLQGVQGAILIFLPGIFEINRMITYLQQYFKPCSYVKKIQLFPLHSNLSVKEQNAVFQTFPSTSTSSSSGQTIKIICATNIAEASITIPDVTIVIDSCKVKEMQYDHLYQTNKLVTTWASQYNLKQRQGRAGRIQEGKIGRLLVMGCVFQCLYDVLIVGAILSSRSPFLSVNYNNYGNKGGNSSNSSNSGNNRVMKESEEMARNRLKVEATMSKYSRPLINNNNNSSNNNSNSNSSSKKNERLRLRSDFEMLLRLLLAYEENQNPKQFCQQHGLVYERILDIEDCKKDLFNDLVNSNILPKGITTMSTIRSHQVNQNAISYQAAVSLTSSTASLSSSYDVENRVDIFRSVCVTGLYPNIALILRPPKRFHEIMGSAFEKEIQAEDIKLFIPVYPNNTNNNINTNISNSNSIGGGNSESDSRDLVILFVYADKYIPPSSSSTSNNNNSNSDGEKVFLQYTSEIIPWALLLFAGKMNYQYKEQSLVIDDYIHFQCSEETFIVLSTLQSVLDSLLFLPADSGKETQSTIAKDDNDRDDDGNGDKVWMMMMEKREELLDCVRALLLVDCTSSSQQP
eukprot:gene5004-5495_t